MPNGQIKLQFLLPFLFLAVIFSFVFGVYTNNLVDAQQEVIYPGDSGYIAPSPRSDCEGRSCDCGSSADCNADCSSCWCTPPCSGTGECDSGSDCDSGDCGAGCRGTGTCSDHKCHWNCDCGTSGDDDDDDDDDDPCAVSIPTGLSLQTPTNGSTVIQDINFSWGLTSWGQDCDDPADNNSFELCLGEGTTYDGILCPSLGGGGCYIYGVADSSLAEDCTYPYTDLDPATEYHWYVKANNGAAFSSSSIYSFTTGGSITGHVWKNDTATDCADAQSGREDTDSWEISCYGGSIGAYPGLAAQKSGNVFTCQDSDNQTSLAFGSYTLLATPPDGWSVMAYCPSNSVTLDSQEETLDIYLRSYLSDWWQVVGGDVWAAAGSINSQVPSGADNPYLLLDGSGVDHGVLAASGGIDPGDGTIAQDGDNWAAKGVGVWSDKTYNYSYWLYQLSGELSDWQGTLSEGLWKTTGDITLNGQTVSGKVFLLTDGQVNITGNIIVSSGASLVVVAQGNITIDPAVTQLQGYYISNGIISTGHDDAGDAALVVEGGLIGLEDVNLERDFQGSQNNTTPAEVFTFRPDILVNLPEEIKIKDIKSWKEVAP